MPERIVLSRQKGWRMPENTVKVDRSTKWGNPFIPGQDSRVIPGRKVQDKRHAYSLYLGFAPQQERLVEAARTELRGKNLACWCPKPDPYEDCCHAAVLLKIANSEGDANEAVRWKPEKRSAHPPIEFVALPRGD